MTSFINTITETFHVVSCYTCGIRFGIGGELYKRVVTDAEGSVSCPACGKLTCWQESYDKKRIRELERKLVWEMQQATTQKRLRDEAEKSLKATRGVVTRFKRRAAAGVCPCCQRTFRQLSQHMANKHPNFAATA